jgi:hypothetical protein
MSRQWLWLIVCLAVTARPCEADAITQTKGPASLEVVSEEKTLSLADLITVTLTVEGSPALDVYGAPLELSAADPWLLVERSKAMRETIDPKRVRWRLTYRFAPREPGRIAFAFPVVKYRDGDEQTASWTPVSFDVHATVTTPDRADLRDITAIEELPPIAPSDQAWRVWSALAGSMLLLSAVVLGVRRFLRRKSLRSPAQFALYEWQRLVALKLPDQGRGERFITLLTTLVRRYLERQWALPARRQTTPEFLQSLEACAALTAEEKQFLTNFLQRCDAVKFAQAAMPVDECNEWADAARQFLQRRMAPSVRA